MRCGLWVLGGEKQVLVKSATSHVTASCGGIFDDFGACKWPWSWPINVPMHDSRHIFDGIWISCVATVAEADLGVW